MAKKSVYTAPLTSLISVRLEASICSGSGFDSPPEPENNGQIMKHEISTTFDGENSFGSIDWIQE